MPIAIQHGPSFVGVGALAAGTGRGRFQQWLEGVQQERERLRLAQEELFQRDRMQERGIRSDEFQQGRSLADQAAAREFGAIINDRTLTRQLEDNARGREFGFLSDQFLQTERFGEDARQRDFAARQAALGRDFTAEQAGLDRSFRSGESALDRQQQTDLQGRSLATGLLSDAARIGASDRQQVRGLTADEILQDARIREAQRAQSFDADTRFGLQDDQQEFGEEQQVRDLLSRLFFQIEDQEFNAGQQDQRLQFQQGSQLADQGFRQNLQSQQDQSAFARLVTQLQAQQQSQAFAQANENARTQFQAQYGLESQRRAAGYELTQQAQQQAYSLSGAQMQLAQTRLESGWQHSPQQQQFLSRLEQENARIMDAVATGVLSEQDAMQAISRNQVRAAQIVPESHPSEGKFPTGHGIGEIFFHEGLGDWVQHKADGSLLGIPSLNKSDSSGVSFSDYSRLLDLAPPGTDPQQWAAQQVQFFQSLNGGGGGRGGSPPSPAPSGPPPQDQALAQLQQLQQAVNHKFGSHPRTDRSFGRVQAIMQQYGGNPGAMPPDVAREFEILTNDMQRLYSSLAN